MEHTIKLSDGEVMLLHIAIIKHICSHNKKCSNCLLKIQPNVLCIPNKIIKQNIDELNDNLVTYNDK